MPETELEYDTHGKVTGAHFAVNDESHQVIEEFMLAANEAVAEQLDSLGVPFLRRVHPAPDPKKLKAFAEFVRILGYTIDQEQDRFSLQRILEQSADKPDKHAVHYALLRSLKQAVYSPEEEGHYAGERGLLPLHIADPPLSGSDHPSAVAWFTAARLADATEMVAARRSLQQDGARAEAAETRD